MPVLQVFPKKRSLSCSLSVEGKLTIPAPVLDSLGWDHGTFISVNYLLTPLTMLFRKTDDMLGFKLMRRASTTSGRPSGLLSCVGFTKSVLKARLVLPLKNLTPILLRHKEYSLGLMLESVQWTQEEFSQAGRQNISPEIGGIYQLLGSKGEVLRIGEGRINSRIGQHLKNEAYIKSVHTICYLTLADKEETELLEHILLTGYETANGKLPPLNLIRS